MLRLGKRKPYGRSRRQSKLSALGFQSLELYRHIKGKPADAAVALGLLHQLVQRLARAAGLPPEKWSSLK